MEKLFLILIAALLCPLVGLGILLGFIFVPIHIGYVQAEGLIEKGVNKINNELA